MKKSPLLFFIGFCILITWSLGLVYYFLEPWLEEATGTVNEYHPLFRLAVFAPSLSAFLVVSCRHGKRGFLEFAERYLRVRTIGKALAIISAGFILLAVVSLLVQRQSASFESVPAMKTPWYTTLFLLFFSLIADAGPIGEEAGWRGFALPLLQRRFHPFAASGILGLLWGMWHLPAFFVSSLPQSNTSFGIFVFAQVGQAFLYTVIYNLGKGSLWLVIGTHLLMNFLITYFVAPEYVLWADGLLGAVYFFAALILQIAFKPVPETEVIPSWDNMSASCGLPKTHTPSKS